MNHLEDDKLLELALELLENDEAVKLKEHISECHDCREKFEAVKKRMDIIGGFDPVIEEPSHTFPNRRRSATKVWLRAAAILIVGFAAGYFTARYSQPECVNVVGQLLAVNTPADTLSGFVSLERLEALSDSDYLK